MPSKFQLSDSLYAGSQSNLQWQPYDHIKPVLRANVLH